MLEGWKVLWGGVTAGAQAVSNSVNKVAEDTEKAAEKITKTTTALQEFGDKAKIAMDAQLANSFAQSFEQIIDGTKKTDAALKDMLQTIIKIAVRSAILQPLGEKLGGKVSGFFGNLGGGPRLAPGAIARHGGGPVSAGGSYVVGESGPERLVMGNRHGRIIPNSGGGASIVNNISIEGGVTTEYVDHQLANLVAALPDNVLAIMRNEGGYRSQGFRQGRR